MKKNFEIKDIKIEDIKIEDIEEIKIFTPEGVKTFDIEKLSQTEGKGRSLREKIQRIISRVYQQKGVLFVDNEQKEKVDLTRQLVRPLITYKK